MEKVTPSIRAKQLGAMSLVQVVEWANTPRQTLVDTFYKNPEKFDALVYGAIKRLIRHNEGNELCKG